MARGGGLELKLPAPERVLVAYLRATFYLYVRSVINPVCRRAHLPSGVKGMSDSNIDDSRYENEMIEPSGSGMTLGHIVIVLA